MQMSIVKHNYLQLHCLVVPRDHSELELIWEQRGDHRQPSLSLVFENPCAQCQSHPFREAASELSGVILKQDSRCIKFLLELRLKHLQSLNLISTQARLQLHILRFEGRKPLVHLITAHQWTLPHLHEWLL